LLELVHNYFPIVVVVVVVMSAGSVVGSVVGAVVASVVVADELKRREEEEKHVTSKIDALLSSCPEGTMSEMVQYVDAWIKNGRSYEATTQRTWNISRAFCEKHHQRLNAKAVAAAVQEFSDPNYNKKKGEWRSVLEKRKTAEFTTLKPRASCSEFERQFEYDLYSKKYESIEKQMSFIECTRIHNQLKTSLADSKPDHKPDHNKSDHKSDSNDTKLLKLWYVRMEAAPSYNLRGDILIAAAATRQEALRYFLERVGEPQMDEYDEEYHYEYLRTLSDPDSIVELDQSKPGIVFTDGYVGTE
jgi:hypothetical protein